MADETPKSEKQEDPRYSREEVLARSRAVTGQPSHVVAGALAGSRKQTFTDAEVEKLTERFVKRSEHSEEEDSS